METEKDFEYPLDSITKGIVELTNKAKRADYLIGVIKLKNSMLDDEISDQEKEIQNALHYARAEINDIENAYNKGLFLDGNNLQAYAKRLTNAILKTDLLKEQKSYNKMILDILEGKRDEKVLCDTE